MGDRLICHNGYVARLYGKASMSIYKNGHEILHTGNRKPDTDEEVKLLLDKIPEFMNMIEAVDRGARQMTNSYRIRNMSDEELAAVLMCPYDTAGDPIDVMPCFKDGTQNMVDSKHCIQCSVEWLQRETKEPIHYNAWIDIDTQKPEPEEYILLSLSNFSLPMIGRYEEDEYGGNFYIGDDTKSCISQNLYVNAWMPLPKPQN